MCGIFGYISTNKPTDEAAVQRAIDAIKHRGPDGDGIWHNNNNLVWLAHKRLSIIDLDIRSAQPMHDEVQDLTIVFNGEIYNYLDIKNTLIQLGHHFKTTSDTEVILKGYSQWGHDILQHLKGMFAFALYDPKKQEIFLARDRMGEKPLFLFIDNNKILFASELKALMAMPEMPRQVNLGALEHLLAYGYTSRQHCILEGYSKLPPAHAITINLQSLAIKKWQYWSAPSFETQLNKPNEPALLNELQQVLETAVGRQLIADVPVGILLSGGVDSSLVTALAVQKADHVHTYNVSFPGTAEDESEFAKEIAQYFGTQHTTIPAEAASVEWLPMLAAQFDEPMTDQSLIPTYMLCRMVRKHCTVALGGDGADELFGGYHRYQRMISLQKTAAKFPAFILKSSAAIAREILPLGFKGRHSILELATDFKSGLPVDATLFDPPWRSHLMPNRNLMTQAEMLAAGETVFAESIADRAMRTDLVRYMPEDILVKSDRAAMLASLEVRAPFLDVDVVEFALRNIPTSLKVNSSERKIMLKRLGAKLLPPTYNTARKQGFVPPLEKWLEDATWQRFFKDTLLTTEASWFDKKAIEKLLVGQQKGQFNKRRIFALLMIELWRKQYNISLP